MTAEWRDYPGDDGAPHTVAGTVKRLASLRSPELDNERDIYVYLPPSYAHAPDRRYPVLYMHDGQNLFDDATAFAGEWRVDDTLEAAAGKGVETIVVGVSNLGDARFDEYSPFRDGRHRAGGRGDAYVAFLVDTLKPRVDADFRTRPEPEATGIMGSSLGGLISVHAFFERPGTFGFMGAMSPALWPGRHRILRQIEGRPAPGGRVYLDVGTREGWKEVRDVLRLRRLLWRKGYREGRDLLYVRDRGGRHREADWGRRFRRAVEFFLEGAGAAEEVGRRVG